MDDILLAVVSDPSLCKTIEQWIQKGGKNEEIPSAIAPLSVTQFCFWTLNFPCQEHIGEASIAPTILNTCCIMYVYTYLSLSALHIVLRILTNPLWA